MAQFHFVADYKRHVADLKAKYPLDEAMSLAVGGSYDAIGEIASRVLLHAGVTGGMSALDFGCGSGRVAAKLSTKVNLSRFLGTDIVQDLLDYAATKTPPHYKYILHRDLSIPAEDRAFDIAYAFSVFTHLFQAESFIYLQDIHRTLKPGGRLVISFLEMAEPELWRIFEHAVEQQRRSISAPLTAFVERNQIEAWASHIGYSICEFVGASEKRWDGHALGQSVVIMEKLR